MSDTHSWLGSLAEKRGDLAEAAAHFTAEARGLAAILRADPDTMRWRFEWADSLSFQSGILAITGKVGAARARVAEARMLAAELTSHDPSNRDWQLLALRLRIREAGLILAEGGSAEAAKAIAGILAELERRATDAPLDRTLRMNLTAAWRLQAEALSGIDWPGATAAAARAVELGEALLQSTSSEPSLTENARAQLLAATIAGITGDSVTRQRHAQRAWELLESRLAGTSDWRLLDPAARALLLLGREQPAGELIARLQQLGYHPTTPWPAAPVTPTTLHKSRSAEPSPGVAPAAK